MGQFVPKVEAGMRNEPDGKRQSIRNFRRRPLKVGERLCLYFAQRSKWCKKLGESKVNAVHVIVIKEKSVSVYEFRNDEQSKWPWHEWNPIQVAHYIKRLKLLCKSTNIEELNAFAQSDGFENWCIMKRWWKITHGSQALPYAGNLYKW